MNVYAPSCQRTHLGFKQILKFILYSENEIKAQSNSMLSLKKKKHVITQKQYITHYINKNNI